VTLYNMYWDFFLLFGSNTVLIGKCTSAVKLELLAGDVNDILAFIYISSVQAKLVLNLTELHIKSNPVGTL